jgi:hypothetical protein
VITCNKSNPGSSYGKENIATMKKLLTLSIALLLTGTTITAQTIETERLYQKYRGEQGVVSLWIPGIVMRLAANIADLEPAEAAFLRSIRSIRLLTIDDPDLYPGVNFINEAHITSGINGYEVMMQVASDGDDVMILGRERNGKLKDMLVLVGGDDNAMVHIKGRLNADMIGAVAQIAGKDGLSFSNQL